LVVLKELLSGIHNIPEPVMDELLEIWTPVQPGRKELLTICGNVEKYIYVVLDGVQRVYYLDDLDREATIFFTCTPSFSGELDSFYITETFKVYF
jgi:hypothetical protein